VSSLISSFARNRHEDVIPRVHAFNMFGVDSGKICLELPFIV
jgi:hypothetical protein